MRREGFVGLILAILATFGSVGSVQACLQEHPRRAAVHDEPVLIDTREGLAPTPPRGQEPPRHAGLPSVDLQARIKDVQVTSKPEGDFVTLQTEDGSVELTPAEYVRALALTKAAVEHGGFFYRLFNISKPWGFLWISIGFLGQAMFTFRMLLQWWASEKHKRSVVPVGFWWGSLIGGAMLFAYFVWRKDIVGIVGQSTGVFVYARNLVLIYRGRRIEAEGARALPKAEPGPATT